MTSQRGWLTAATASVSGAVAQYTGAAVAVNAFAATGPTALSWTRNLVAAIVLALLFRPSLRGWNKRRVLRVTGFGVATLLTNAFLYEAIARIPLGTAAAIEFCGPVVVGLIGARSWHGYLAALLCAAGVACISGVTSGGETTGLLYAVAAAICFGAKIVFTAQVASGPQRRQDLAAGLIIAVVLFTPLASHISYSEVNPGWIREVILIGALSTVVPYFLDQVTARLVGPSGLAVMASLLPVVAAITGFFVLGQVLSLIECLGIALVCAAVTTKALEPTRPR